MLFTFLCPPYAGHLDPMFAIARALRARGHDAVFAALADLQPAVEAAGFRIVPVGCDAPGLVLRMRERVARLDGLGGIRGVIGDMAALTDRLCRELEPALPAIGPDAIVSDQLEAAGGLLAQRFGLPHVSVANALMIDREPYVPPPFTDWRYARSRWARERNLGGYRVSDWLMRDVSAVIARWSAAWGLPPRTRVDECLSRVQVGQLSSTLDFPREQLPGGFAYAGPLRRPIDDDAEWHPSRPGPYAFVSLGTLQGGRFELFARITQACRDLGLTAVVAHGGRLSAEQEAALPGEPIVAAMLPQRRVIARSELVITHGGMNTVLDALAEGVPLLLTPLAMEQGAIAQRVVRAGAGLRARTRRPAVSTLRGLVEGVLRDPAHRANAAAVAASLRAAGGAARAACVIERHAAA